MKAQAVLWAAATAYFGALGLLYLAISGEPAGSVLLLVGAGFGGLVAGWLWRRTGVGSPGDGADDEGADPAGAGAAGPVGTFPSASLRPLGLAAATTGVLLGLVVGLWLTVTSVALLGSQIALLTRDADR